VVLPLLSIVVSWCAGGRCGMVGNDENCGKSRRPSAEDRGWSSTGRILSDRVIERSGNLVCGLHCAQGDEEREFLGLTSKPRSTVSLGLTLKLVVLGFSV
jgi:hypothetical protein